MTYRTLAAGLFGLAVAAGLVLFGDFGDRGAAQQDKPKPFKSDEIIQEFPIGAPMQTAWKIRYVAVNPGPGLVITGAWFKTDPNADFSTPPKFRLTLLAES